ncbi:metallophosphoesterase [Ensifer aridi]|uniref:metallophosphoesterase n=1 Tax=Ensifer aridi TaxID=1708715 RepID=UPI00111BDAEF|nr:metallophosphoesterase [Ensifer aridi]
MTFTTKHYMGDPHFGHMAMLRFQPKTRPFSSFEEMDQAIIERTKERVRKDDLLFILGDFAFSKDDEYVRHCFHELPGRKVLILGNHDLDRDGSVRKVIAKLPWYQPPTHAMSTKEDGGFVWLSHYGHRVWPGSHKGSFHFYGHSHNNLPPTGRSRDVGVDVPDMGLGPRTFAELIKNMVGSDASYLDEVEALTQEVAGILPSDPHFSLAVSPAYFSILQEALRQINDLIVRADVVGNFEITNVMVHDGQLYIRPRYRDYPAHLISMQQEIADIIGFAEAQADEIHWKENGDD